MSKLSLHLQHCPAWVPQFIERSGVEWIKWIDPPEQDPGWGVKVIGRTFEPDGESNARIWQGAGGARGWFDKWLPFYLSRTWVHCWEAPNEPQPMADAQFRACLNEFTVELARLMHAAGLRLVGMNWSVGWPDVGHAPEMGEGVQACDYLGLHEYCAPAMWDGEGWYTLRYRRSIAELTEAGFTVPPIIVTECGIDGGVIAQPRTGWKTFTDNFDQYLDQLAWYSGELDKDNVAAATIFTVCDWDWHDFAITEAEAMPLADWIAQDDGDDGDNGGEEPYMDVKVFGYISGEDGPQEEKSWDWLVQEFGPLDLRLAEPSLQNDGTMQVVRLIELREQYGPVSCNVELLDINGSPVEGINGAWHYSTAPALPNIPPPTSVWEPNAVYGPTNSEGVVGHAMSEDSYYQPALGEIGPYGAWFLAPGHPCDGLFGIGMVWATNHRHVNLRFQVVIVDDGPDPEPEGDLEKQVARCADALEGIDASLAKIAGLFK